MHARLAENNLLLIWPMYPQRKPSGSDCGRTHAHANETRSYDDDACAVHDAQCNTKESP